MHKKSGTYLNWKLFPQQLATPEEYIFAITIFVIIKNSSSNENKGVVSARTSCDIDDDSTCCEIPRLLDGEIEFDNPQGLYDLTISNDCHFVMSSMVKK